MAEKYYDQVLRDELIDFLDWFVCTDQNDLNFDTTTEYVDLYLKSIKDKKKRS